MILIKTENLSKHYGDIKAVTDINLNVRKGEIYGFLGLNGAGKTTTIRLILGMIRATNGYAFIKGKKVHANNLELWKNIGYLVEVPYSYPNLTVFENIDMIRRLRFIKDKQAVNDIIKKLELEEYVNRKAKNLSLGNAQRLGLAKALIHHPDILILDEPTNGLDPAGIHDIREMLKDLAKNQGVSIFISSHILSEISRFAARIGIIHKGRIIKEIDSDQLDRLCEKELLIQTKDLRSAQNIISNQGFKDYKLTDNTLKIKDTSAIEHPEKIAKLLTDAGQPPSLLHVCEEDLESYFLRTIKMNGGIK